VKQRGAVAVMFLLMVIVLLGFAGLATDVARITIAKSELQTAADACALAAVGALTGASTTQLAMAEAAGMLAARANRIAMQSVAASPVANSSITFSATANGSYAPKNALSASQALSMKYVRCELTENNLPVILMGVVRALGQQWNPGEISARAVASFVPSGSNCALPIAVCRKAGSAAPSFGYTVGEWLPGRFKSGSGVAGKYKWVQFPGYTRTKDLVDLIAKNGQCNLTDTQTLVPDNGVMSTLQDAWNWRFGVKKNSGPPAGALPPDYSGFAYTAANWASQTQAFPNFITQRAINAVWNREPNLTGGWSASTKSVHAAGADRRLVVMPIVDCAGWDVGGTSSQPILGWACVFLLNPVSGPSGDMALEFRGPASDPASGCLTSGAPGRGGAGRPRVPGLVM